MIDEESIQKVIRALERIGVSEVRCEGRASSYRCPRHNELELKLAGIKGGDRFVAYACPSCLCGRTWNVDVISPAIRFEF